MALSQQHANALVQCTQRQLEIQKGLHQLACQELVLVKDKRDHEQQYHHRDVQERLRTVQRELSLAQMENEQLKLDGLRQRKQNSILRLKLASAKEDVDLLQRNMALVDQHSHRLAQQVEGLTGSLAAATQQLTDVSAAKAVLQADAAKHQNEALQASMEVSRLREDLKLATGRLNTATGQAADLLQQLKAVQAENASLLGQLAVSQGKDTEAAAAHTALQEALQGMKSELTSLRERLAVEEQGRAAAEAAAAKHADAAESAADALAVKEQQMAAWKDLEQASKATATQQMQLSQAQLDSMHQRATATESKLLDQITALQQQLDKERSARCAAEINTTAAASQVAAERATLEQEVLAMRQQVSEAKSELSAAQAAAAREARRAAALQQDLEHLQEQAAKAAAETVEGLVEGLTQGQETEDESEQPPLLQHRHGAAATAAAANTVAAAGRRKLGQAAGRGGPAVAATPAAQAAVFGTGLVAQLSGIEEADEASSEDVVQEEEQQWGSQKKQEAQQQQEQQQEQAAQPASMGGGRRPRSAKSRAQAHIKAAAAADKTPPSAAAAADGVGNQRSRPQAPNRTSPRSKTDKLDTQPDSLAGAGCDDAGQPQPQKLSRKQQLVQQQQQQEEEEEEVEGSDYADEAPAASGAPPLGFVPQSTVTPAAALKQPGVMKAAAERLSAASMLKKLNQGGTSFGGKPGARKRKIGPVTGNGSMDVLPSNLIMSTGFKPPKVRHLG